MRFGREIGVSQADKQAGRRKRQRGFNNRGAKG